MAVGPRVTSREVPRKKYTKHPMKACRVEAVLLGRESNEYPGGSWHTPMGPWRT